MVSVVSGSGFGLVNTSRGVVGANGELGQGSVGRAGERLTVNAANGNLVVQNQDGLLVGVGPDVGLVRTYNSQGGWDGGNGDAWRLGFYRRIAGLTGTLNTAGSMLRRVEADGNEALFTFRDGRYVGTDGAGAYDTLVVTASTATWTDGDSGITETYLSAGSEAGTWRLTQITDTEGHSVRVTYDTQGLISTLATWKAGATTADETVTLVYDTNKRLNQIDTAWRDDAGAHTRTLTRYTYDGSGRLQSVITDLTPDDRSVTDGKTYTVTYGYDGGRLSSLTQSDGTSLTILYEAGRVKTITDALGQVTTFTYDTTNRRTTVADARGQAAVLGYDNASRLLTLGGAVTPMTLAYDGDGNILTSTDGLGRQTQFAYDAQGNLTRSTDASGRVLDSVSDTANRLTSQTQHTELGTGGAALTTRYVYDTTNGLRRLRFVLSAEGRVTEQQYNSLGQVLTRISYATNRFSGDATLAALTTWAGQQPTAGAAQQRQTYTYDLRGALRTQSDGRSTTTYVYDPFGRLVQTIDPQAGSTTYSYDGMDRLLLRTDSRGVQTLYGYDDTGRTSSITWANGLRDVSTYDTAGQLLTQAQFNGSSALGQTTYAYDKAGRLRMVTDPTGQRRWQLYDEAGRLSGTVDAQGHLTEITYDAAGRAVLSTGYAAAVDLTKLVDAQGVPIDVAVATLRPASDPNDRRQWSVYDEAGRLLWQVNSVGEATETRYDGAGRAVALVQHGQRVATLPAAGSAMPLATLTSLGTNASEPDHVSRSFYDAQGLLRGTLDAEGYLTELRYDAAGRLVERIAYATATPQAQRAAGTLAALTPATSDDDRRSLGWFDAQGRTVAELDADGFFTEHTYNNAGQRTQTQRYATGLAVAAAKAATPTTDPATLRPAASTEDHRASWTYDVLGRVRTETGADGAVTQFTYDDLGRLTRSDRALSTADQRSSLLRYDAQGRVIAELSALGAALLQDGQTQAQVDAIWAANSTQHAYDTAGRRIRSTDAKGQVTLLYYDTVGRLAYRITKTDQGGEVEALRYNAFGEVRNTQRYSKRLSTADTNVLQGGQATAALDQKRDALVDLSDRTSTSFFNTVGRLTQVMDALGNKTDYVYDAFGQLSRSTASIDADGGTLRRLVTQIARDRRGLATTTTQDPSGLAVVTRTEYDAFGRVTASVDGLNRRTSFKYAEGDGKPDGGRQVVITDATGAQRGTTYDAFDRTVRQTDALGNSVSFQYNTSARRLTLTTANGVVTVTDSNAHGQVVKVSDAQGTTTYEYDANGNRVRSTDALGNVVQDDFDAINRLKTHTVDPAGLKLKTTYEYDAANRVLSQRVDPDGLNLATSYQYDGQGRAVRITDPAGVVTRYDLDGEGRLATMVVDEAGLKLTTRTTYDAQGRVLTVRRLADTTAANVSAAQVTEYHYDLLGRRIQEVQDPAGLRLTTTYDYDAAGQVVRVSDTLGVRKRYVYDAAGRETYCIDALGGTERKEYDAEGRLLRDTHYANAIVTSGLPVAATSTQIKDLLSPNAAADLVERRSYNKDGLQRFVIDAQGGVSETRYDSLGRVSQSTGYATMLSGADLTSAMDLATTNNQISTLAGKIDDAGRDHTTRFAYDGAGRLRFAVDAAGAVTETVYDKASRAIRTVQYANTLATGATIQAPATDAARDRITRTVYDAAGRTVQQVDAEGYLTVNQYDKAGNLTQTVRYASRAQRADALTAGTRVTVLSASATPPDQGAYLLEDSTLTNITNFQYDRLNRRTLSIDGEQRLEVSVYNDALGATVQRQNAVGGVATLVYDAVGRLVQETLPVTALAADGTQVPVVNRYEYDVRGNRTKAIEAFGLPEQRTTLYRFDAMNRLVRTIGMAYTAVDAAGTARLVTPVDVVQYNALGQMDRQTTHATLADPGQPDGATSGGRISTAEYDRAGRKVAEVATDGVRSEFGYNAFGDQVQQTVRGGSDPDRTLHYSYDLMGRRTQTRLDGVWTWEFGQPITVNGLAAEGDDAAATGLAPLTLERVEYDAFGNAVRHFDARGNTDYAYFDRLGRKLMAIDAAGFAIAWDYDRSNAVATQETRYARQVPIAYGVQGSGTTPQAIRTALAQLASDPTLVDRVTRFTLDRVGRVTAKAVLNVDYAYVQDGTINSDLLGTGRESALTQYNYDGLGNVTQIRERTGLLKQGQDGQTEVWQVTDIGYDLLGREIRRQTPAYTDMAGGTSTHQPLTETVYDGLGSRLQVIRRGRADATGASQDRVTTYSYDGNGRTLTVTSVVDNGSSVVITSDFNADGDLSHQSRGYQGSRPAATQTFRYDAAGRLVDTTISQPDLDPQKSVTLESRQMRYNAFGEVVAQGTNGGTQEWFQYTALGKVWKTNAGDGTVKIFLHDGNGNVTRELRAGLGSSTVRDFKPTALAGVLADATLVSTVHVYDVRNLEVRTIQPRMNRLADEQTLSEQFDDIWVAQAGDLNPARAAAPGRSAVTVSNGSRTALTGGVPGTAIGGTGNSTGAAVSRALPFGSLMTFPISFPNGSSPIPIDSRIPPSEWPGYVRDISLTEQIPGTWPAGKYRISETIDGVTRVHVEVPTAGGFTNAGSGGTTSIVTIDWQPDSSTEWLTVSRQVLTKTLVQPASSGAPAQTAWTWTQVAPDTKLFIDLTPLDSAVVATRFVALVDPDSALGTVATAVQPLSGGHIGMIDLSLLPISGTDSHQIEILALNDQDHVVAGRKLTVQGQRASSVSDADGTLYAGNTGMVWATHTRDANRSLTGARLNWDAPAGHAGAGTLSWRKAGATADPWNARAITQGQGSVALSDLAVNGTPLADGTYYVLLEQGGTLQQGSFTVTGGAITIAENRLKPMSLTPERVTINGPVDAQGRGRVALTVGSVTVTATTDANGQASFDLSQIRQSLGLDRWSVGNKAFSYIGYIDRGNGQKQMTHAEHGTVDLRAPRIDSNDTFKFNADSLTEYEAEATLTLPSTAGTVKLTPVGGTAVTLTLGSDWRLSLAGSALTVNLDGWRPAWGAADQLVDWAYTGTDGKTASGRLRLTDKGVVTREGAASGTPVPQLRLTPPAGSTATTLTLNLGNNQTAQLSPTSTANGVWLYDLKPYLPTSGTKSVTYSFQTNAAATALTRGSGTLTLAADGTVTSTAFDERRITGVTFRLDGIQAAQAKVNIAGVGTVTLTGTWVPVATVTNPDGSNATPASAQGYTRFDWDATAASASNGPATFTYDLTALDASGASLGAAQSGRIVVDPNHAKQPVQLQRQAKALDLDDDFTASIWRTYTAFGELNEELDDRVVERAVAILGRALTGAERFTESTRYRYNTLGKLVARTEAAANVTAENGFTSRVRAVTSFGYDLLGRLNTQTDANGNQTLQGLLAGSADVVVLRYSVDGDRHIDYNDFGEVMRVADEAGNKTTTVHDQLGRVTKVTRGGVWRVDVNGVRIRNTSNPNDEATDTYTYDALGHQVTHTDALGQTFHTDYDGLGRVVSTYSPTLHITRYDYSIVDVVGLGGTTTGTRKITRLASGMSLTDDQDQFGHTTRHVDLGGTVYTYRYDAAGRLSQQTSSVHAGQVNGQSISFDYYANGALKTQSDNVAGTLTDYAYDDTGLRSGEAYYRASGGLRVATFQSDTLAYDELGRVREVADANNYKVRYEYDAVGNRRLNDASYWDGTAWRQQVSWYLYDPMNRLVVGKGALVNATDGKPAARGTSLSDTSVRIVAGVDGVSLAYDALGHRVRASYTVKDPAKPGDAGKAVTEAYDVSGDGVVLTVKQDGLKVARSVDAIGRTRQERDLQNNTLTDYSYDAENRLVSQHLADFKDSKRESDTTTTYLYEQSVGSSSTAPSATGAGALAKTVSHNDKNKTPDLTTTTTYEYWDDARQKKVEKTGQTSGSIDLRYDASGHLVEQTDKAVGLTTNFFNSANGLVMQRERMQNSTQVGFHKFFYADGKRVGDIRNDPGDNAHLTYAEELAQKGQTPPDNTQLDRTFKPVVVADFDQNFEPVNGGSPGGSASSYVVRQGDTLQGVALQLWGDASLWYLIAERSGLYGLSPSDALVEGQVLQVPNQVTNIHHNSQTLRPYNPAEAIGNVDPSLPPAVLDDNRCATYAKIIVVAVVAVVATVVTAGAAAPLLGVAGAAGGIFATGTAVLTGGAALSWGVVGAAAIGGAVGNIVSQGVAIGLDLQDEFSWKQVGQAALGSAITAGVGAQLNAMGVLKAAGGVQGALNAAGRSALGTGANLLLHTDWNWRQVMASAAGAAAGAAVSSALDGSRLGNLLGAYGRGVAERFTGSAVQARVAARGDDHVDYGGLFASTLGSVAGDRIVDMLTPQDPLGDFIDQKLNEQRARDVYGLGRLGPVRLGDGGRGPRLGGPTGNLADELPDAGDGTGPDAAMRGIRYAAEAGQPRLQKTAQAGGHFFLPLLIAQAAGLSDERLSRIIEHSQSPDQLSLLDGLTNGVRNYAAGDEYGPAALGKLSERALHALNGKSTRENFEFYQTVISENRDDDAMIGLALHGLVDSQFHSHMVDGISVTYDAPLGHGAHGSEPDYVTREKLTIVTGQIITAFETVTGNSLSAEQRDAVFGSVNGAFDRAASRAAQQIDEINGAFEMYGIQPRGPALSMGERTELNFRDVVREMVPNIPGVKLEELPSPFFRGPINAEGTYSEGRTFWRHLPEEQADALTRQTVNAAGRIMDRYRDYFNDYRISIPVTPNGLYDDKVWSARRFIPGMK